MPENRDGAVAASARARCEAKYAVESVVRQHRVRADEPLDRGGGDSAASPFELLAAGLASCTAITLRMYAERKGWDLGTIEVECRALVHGDGYRVERTVRCAGALDDAQRAALLRIAERTPVTKVVKVGAPIETRFG